MIFRKENQTMGGIAKIYIKSDCGHEFEFECRFKSGEINIENKYEDIYGKNRLLIDKKYIDSDIEISLDSAILEAVK